MKKILSVLLFMVLCSCSNSVDSTSAMTFNELPVVQQMVITDEQGNQLGTWYNPGQQLSLSNPQVRDVVSIESERVFDFIQSSTDSIRDGWLPVKMQMYYPYPNPASGGISIQYSVPKISTVSLWIVPATLGQSASENTSLLPGQVFLSENQSGSIVTRLINEYKLDPGRYMIHWSGTNSKGNPVPSGFYRIYCQIDEHLFYADIFIYRQISDLPASLKKYVS